jgi:hypothetical protein
MTLPTARRIDVGQPGGGGNQSVSMRLDSVSSADRGVGQSAFLGGATGHWH